MSTVVPARDLLNGACEVFEADSVPALTASLAKLTDDNALWETLSMKARARTEIMFDRNRSWGSQLWKALLAAAPDK